MDGVRFQKKCYIEFDTHIKQTKNIKITKEKNGSFMDEKSKIISTIL